GDHEQMRHGGSFFPEQQDERDDLDGFPQAHVVGQASAKAVIVQKIQPADPLLLVCTQPGVQLGRNVRFVQSFQLLQAGFQALQVGLHPFHFRLQHSQFAADGLFRRVPVYQFADGTVAGLWKTDLIPLDFSHAEIIAESLQPFLGKNAPCAVIQAEVSAFIPYGLLDLPKGDAPGSEADIQFGVEPVVAAEEPDRDLCFMRIQPVVPELVESKNTDAALLPVVERVEEPVVVQEMLPVQVKIGQLLFDLLVE